MDDTTIVTATVHLYRGEPDVDIFPISGPLVVKVDGLTIILHKPEALAGFLLAIAQSTDAQQFLALAGAGFSMTVEPLPQPEPTTYCSGCGFVAGVYPSHRTGCPVAAGDAIDAAMQRAELRQEAGL